MYKLYSQTLVCGTIVRTTRHVQPLLDVSSSIYYKMIHGTYNVKISIYFSLFSLKHFIISNFLYFNFILASLDLATTVNQLNLQLVWPWL